MKGEKNEAGRMKTQSVLKINIQSADGEAALECEKKFDLISSNLCLQKRPLYYLDWTYPQLFSNFFIFFKTCQIFCQKRALTLPY